MEKIKIFKLLKGQKEGNEHPLRKSTKGYSESVLTPVSMTGVNFRSFAGWK